MVFIRGALQFNLTEHYRKYPKYLHLPEQGQNVPNSEAIDKQENHEENRQIK